VPIGPNESANCADSSVNNDSLNSDNPWELITKTSVHYNIGHLAAAEGDTVSPDGKYLVALNKWAIDRFSNVGPLLPQNFQLLDISESGTTMWSRSFISPCTVQQKSNVDRHFIQHEILNRSLYGLLPLCEF